MQPIARSVQRVVWPPNGRNAILFRMIIKTTTLLLTAIALMFPATPRTPAPLPASGPEYSSDGQLKFPEHYREWVYLTTGFDMSYSPNMQMDHHMFDNVFVNPEAYKVFMETGTWPDKTMLVLEVRGAVGKGSINQKGNYQSPDLMGLEVHIKDEAHYPDKWAFVGFGSNNQSRVAPPSADCYSCHKEHAAVDTTFVQFYPTLLPVARSKGTLSAAYLKESAEPAKK